MNFSLQRLYRIINTPLHRISPISITRTFSTPTLRNDITSNSLLFKRSFPILQSRRFCDITPEERNRLLTDVESRLLIILKKHLVDFLNAKQGSEKALTYFTKVKNEGVIPDTESYDLLLQICSEESNMDKVLEVLSDMKKNQVQASSRTHTLVLDILAKYGRSTEIITYMRTLEKSKITSAAYSALIESFSSRDDFVGALSAFTLLKNAGVLHQPTVFATMIRCAAVHKQVETAETCWKLMEDMKIKPNGKCYTSMILAYSVNNQLMKAIELLELPYVTDPQPWATLLLLFVKRDVLKEESEKRLNQVLMKLQNKVEFTLKYQNELRTFFEQAKTTLDRSNKGINLLLDKNKDLFLPGKGSGNPGSGKDPDKERPVFVRKIKNIL